MFYDQDEFEIRCEWGLRGVKALAGHSDVVVIVDVLSFCTCVDIAVSRGAVVYPFGSKDESAAAYAARHDAVLANPNRAAGTGYSLSPSSLVSIPAGTRLVLPSPNGATLSMATDGIPTFAGCLRNARCVAAAAGNVGQRIAVIPAGERWEDGSLRPAIEDWIGAGAVIHGLKGNRSPEAAAAETAFLSVRENLAAWLRSCSSAKELIERGFAADVDLALALDASETAPQLVEQGYRG